MIFVVEYEKSGNKCVDVLYQAHLETDKYEQVNKIFFCDNYHEVQAVLGELKKEIPHGYE
jgi:hypothetical protein